MSPPTATTPSPHESVPMSTPCECGVTALATVRVPWGRIAELRSAPAGPGSEALGAHVRVADEQTVVGLAALARARDPGACYRDWGVIASARSFGRLRFAAAVARFGRLNARGASPLVIPHVSPHAMPGTLSLTLGLHGPHLAGGSGPGHLAETLLLGLSVVRRERLPGLWVVAADLSPDPGSGPEGDPAQAPTGQAVALALTASGSAGRGRLRLLPQHAAAATDAPDERMNLTRLIDYLADNATDAAWQCRLPGLGTLELRTAAAAALPRAA